MNFINKLKNKGFSSSYLELIGRLLKKFEEINFGHENDFEDWLDVNEFISHLKFALNELEIKILEIEKNNEIKQVEERYSIIIKNAFEQFYDSFNFIAVKKLI